MNRNGKEKEAPQEEKAKRSFTLFWSLIFKNTGPFFWMNFIYGLFFVPVLVCVYFLIRLFFVPDTQESDYQLFPLFVYLPLALSVFLGPVTSAMTYVERKILTKQRFFFWSDFYEQLKKNFKQSIVFGFLDTVCVMALGLLLPYLYGLFSAEKIPSVLVAFLAFFFFICFLYYSMRPYIYLQIVSINLRVGQIVRNALFFAVLGVKNNLFSFFIFAAACVGTALLVPWSIILLVTVEFSLLWFAVIWFSYKKFYQLLIEPELEREKESEALDAAGQENGQ